MPLFKQVLKSILFGRSLRPRRILFGPAAGLCCRIDPAIKSQRLLGLDEFEISACLPRFLFRSAGFADIGASADFYTLTALHLNPEIRVAACDMDPGMADPFHENFLLNPHLPQNAGTWHTAMAGKPGIMLDSLCRNLPHPLLVKMDVEGAEYDAIKSGPGLLQENEVDFLIETHSLKLENDLVFLLQNAGYETRIIPQAWWRLFIPEQRRLAHNRWMFTSKAMPQSSSQKKHNPSPNSLG